MRYFRLKDGIWDWAYWNKIPVDLTPSISDVTTDPDTAMVLNTNDHQYVLEIVGLNGEQMEIEWVTEDVEPV